MESAGKLRMDVFVGPTLFRLQMKCTVIIPMTRHNKLAP